VSSCCCLYLYIILQRLFCQHFLVNFFIVNYLTSVVLLFQDVLHQVNSVIFLTLFCFSVLKCQLGPLAMTNYYANKKEWFPTLRSFSMCGGFHSLHLTH
jgi:hypothetical protein